MKPRCTVLVVEDDFYVRELLGEALDSEGYRFRLADGEPAMRQALALEPAHDVIVLDANLRRGSDGIALGREMRAEGYPVILVTGDHGRLGEIAECGLPCLAKPFRIAALMRLIDAVLTDVGNKCSRPPREARVEPS